MRVALVGFGMLAQRYYAPALRHRKDVEVTAIADPAHVIRQIAAAALPHARLYDDCDDLFRKEAVDAVLVATPPSTHLDLALAIARRSIPVFVEKPLVLAQQNQKDALTEDRPEWQYVTVNFNRRFWPHYEHVRHATQAGRLGQITSATLTLYANLSSWGGQSNHRLSSHEGGSIHDLGCHLFDLAAFLFGHDISTVKAARDNVDGWTDRIEVNLSMRAGPDITCAFGYGPLAQDRLHITGTGGTAFFRDANCRLWVEPAPRQPFFAPGRQAIQWTGDFIAIAKRAARRKDSMLRWTVAAALNDFFDRVASGTGISSGIDQSRHVASVIAAVMTSLQQGAAVNVCGQGE